MYLCLREHTNKSHVISLNNGFNYVSFLRFYYRIFSVLLQYRIENYRRWFL
nr:MAG TPA: hypothetical protein [Caudoviricetes sp.]